MSGEIHYNAHRVSPKGCLVPFITHGEANPYTLVTNLLSVPEMSEKIKVTDEEILEMWDKTSAARKKAIKLDAEAKMYDAQALYHKTMFWEAVGERYGINTTSVSWSYDSETHTVTRSEEDESPLARLLGGLSGRQASPLEFKDEDDSGVVI